MSQIHLGLPALLLGLGLACVVPPEMPGADDVPDCYSSLEFDERIEGVLGDRTCIAAVYQAYESKLQEGTDDWNMMMIDAEFEPASEEYAIINASLVVPNKVGTYTCPPLSELTTADPQVSFFLAGAGAIAGGKTYNEDSTCTVVVTREALEIGHLFEGTFEASVGQIDYASGEFVLTDVTEGVFRAVRGPHPAF